MDDQRCGNIHVEPHWPAPRELYVTPETSDETSKRKDGPCAK